VKSLNKTSLATVLLWSLLLQIFPGFITRSAAQNTGEQAVKRYRPELVVQTGHSEPPFSITFSPDGKLVASASRSEVLVWDARNGKQLRTVVASSTHHRIEYIAFSPDGRELATFKSRESIDVWDVWSGKRKKGVGGLELVEKVKFTADWTRFVTVDTFELAVWDVESMEKLSSIRAEPRRDESGRVLVKKQLFAGGNKELSVSSDGKKAAVFEGGSLFPSVRPNREEPPFPTTRVFDLKKNVEVDSFPGIYPTYSPDSSLIALYTEDALVLRDESSGNVVRKIPTGFPKSGFLITQWPITFSRDSKLLYFHSGESSSLRGINLENGTEFEPIPIKSSFVFGFAVSNDGSKLAMSGFTSGNASLAEINDLPADAAERGERLATLRKIQVWDVRQGRLISILSGGSNGVPERSEQEIEVSDNRRYATFTSFPGTAVWDFARGVALSYEWQRSNYKEVKIAPDSKKVVVGGKVGVRNGKPVVFGNDRILRSFDLESGRLLWETDELPEDIAAVAFSPKGDTLAVSYTTYFQMKDGRIDRGSGAERRVSFLDPESGAVQREITGLPDSVSLIAFSPEGKHLLLRYKTPSVMQGNSIFWSSENATEASRTTEIWSVPDLRRILVLENTGYPSEAGRFSFSPDSRSLAILQDKELGVWDLATLQKKTSASRQQEITARHPEFIDRIVFSTDSSEVIGEDFDGEFIFRLDPKSQNISVEGANPNGCIERFHKLVLLGRKLHRIRTSGPVLGLTDCDSGKRKVSMIQLNEKDWAVVTPFGYFDATENAMESMHFVVSDRETGYEVIELDQLKSRFYIPGLYSKLAAGEVVGSAADFTVTLNPAIQLGKAGDSNTFKLKAADRGGGVGRIEVRVNGSELFADLRKVDGAARGAEGEFEFTVPPEVLRPGDNSIEVIGWNGEGDVRGRGVKKVVRVSGDKGAYRPRFFAVVGGVSDYPGDEIDLRYASKDAEDMAAALALGARSLLCSSDPKSDSNCDRIEIHVLSTNPSMQAAAPSEEAGIRRLPPTKDNFRRAFTEVSAKAGPGDIFVVYLAGHAVAIRSENALEESGFADLYLYATADAKTLDKNRLGNESERANMISSLELADWLKASKAEKEVLILDTCAAGTAGKDIAAIVTRDGRAEQLKALDRLRERTGFYLLMGSAADSVSYEANRFRQGLLTYSLLEAMSGAALREGEYVDVEDWFGYAEDRVEELAMEIGGVQRPSYFKSNFAKRFDVGRLNESERQRIPLATPVPVILQPQLLDRDRLFDSIKLSESLATELRAWSLNTIRGGSAANINFVPVSGISGGLTPSGLYKVTGELVEVEIALRQGDRTVETIRIKAAKSEIAKKIAEAVAQRAASFQDLK